tara:strand:+ start:17490 stop:18659 length:1170 start_codon:yes stop_codon:yes gene_type:complete
MAFVDYANGSGQRKVAEQLDNGVETAAEISRVLGISDSNARKQVRLLRARAGVKDRTQHLGQTAEGFAIKKTSTNYDKDGNINQQWVIAHQDVERQAELLREYISGLSESVPPAKPVKRTSKNLNPNIMPSIFIGDAHIGMQAYASETRHSDFNVDIACSQLREGADYLIDRAEPAETGLLVDVGDFLHPNGRMATTLKGTPLDTDQTYYRMMKAAGSVMRYFIDKMLTKFGRVLVVQTPGNHNTDPAIGLQIALEFLYANEPRVTILKNESFYNYIEFGKWLLGFSHGDKQKPESLVANMARDMASAWGRTTHRMWCTGHYHKEMVRTFPGCKHKVFGALPPPDSWHASEGYMGDGEMEMITFRKEGGLHSSHTYNIPQPRVEPDVRI